jgi:hypothetical protein
MLEEVGTGVGSIPIYSCIGCSPVWGPNGTDPCSAPYTPDPETGILSVCGGHGDFGDSTCICDEGWRLANYTLYGTETIAVSPPSTLQTQERLFYVESCFRQVNEY